MKNLITITLLLLSYNSFGQITLKDTSEIISYFSLYKPETKYDTIQAIGVKYNWDFDSYVWVGGISYGYDSPQVSYTPMRVIVEVTKYGNLPVRYFKREQVEELFILGTHEIKNNLLNSRPKYKWVEFKPKFDQIIYQNE